MTGDFDLSGLIKIFRDQFNERVIDLFGNINQKNEFSNFFKIVTFWKPMILRVWWFLHFMQLFCDENAPNQSWKHITILIKSKKFRNFCFFSIFFRVMLQNNVCVNLTTKTSKYRIDVSQLSLQCYLGFLISLLSKKPKHIFVQKHFQGLWKIQILSLGSKFDKKVPMKFLFVLS